MAFSDGNMLPAIDSKLDYDLPEISEDWNGRARDANQIDADIVFQPVIDLADDTIIFEEFRAQGRSSRFSARTRPSQPSKVKRLPPLGRIGGTLGAPYSPSDKWNALTGRPAAPDIIQHAPGCSGTTEGHSAKQDLEILAELPVCETGRLDKTRGTSTFIAAGHRPVRSGLLSACQSRRMASKFPSSPPILQEAGVPSSIEADHSGYVPEALPEISVPEAGYPVRTPSLPTGPNTNCFPKRARLVCRQAFNTADF